MQRPDVPYLAPFMAFLLLLPLNDVMPYSLRPLAVEPFAAPESSDLLRCSPTHSSPTFRHDFRLSRPSNRPLLANFG